MDIRPQSPEQLPVNEEKVPVENIAEEITTAASTEQPEEQSGDDNSLTVPLTKAEIIEKLVALSEAQPEDIARDNVLHLKQQYYNARHEETEREKQLFVEEGNNPDDFVAKDDPDEEKLKQILTIIKEKKAEYSMQLEAEQNENLEKKNGIVNEIIALSADTDNVNRLFPRFRELQTEFRNIGNVPPHAVTEIWKKYQDAVERFYDQLKVNKDLRDYDFKKNLEIKEALCVQAEKIAEDKDIIAAFRTLQELHEKWREIGPVAKDVRESLWNRFKEASSMINKKYQAFFEERKRREQENEDAKNAICERLEALELESFRSYGAWESATKKILDAQAEWRTIGFASKKANNSLYERYRAICDRFFAEKSKFYTAFRNELEENLKKKTELCEKAEAVAESTDWKNTLNIILDLQKEWKTIGPVTKKYNDSIWKRFQAACDSFFQRRKKALSGTRQTEAANLKAKKAIIASLNSLDSEMSREDAIKAVRDAQAKWNDIGHVPFRDKDKVYEAYRKIVDELYDKLDIRENRAGIAKFETGITEMKGDSQKLFRERERLVRAYEQKNSELTTCENNLGFFTSTSKSGESMMRELQRRVQRIKEEIASLEQKIKIVDSNLK